MYRAVVPVIAAALTVLACSEDPVQPDVTKPLFQAGEGRTECVGVFTGPAHNVVVPPGVHCEMVGAQVTGNVLVKEGASLRARASMIGGNIHGVDVRFVCLVFATQVEGNLDVEGGDPGTTSGHDIGTRVGGFTRIQRNAGHTFIDAANVGGNIEVSDNTGSIEVEHNTVGGNVDLRLNTVPATFTGDPTAQCGVPTQLQLGIGGLSAFNNQVPNGNLDLFNNVISAGSSMFIVQNNVENVIQVFRNTGPGTKTVTLNVAGQRIQCEHNDPPFVGFPNVAPEQQGQCGPPII
jgi:hypothetical protein